jgi:hypothetical protein
MSIVRKHISKSGKSVLMFRRQPVIGSAGIIPRDAQSYTGIPRVGRPAVRIDAFRVEFSPLSK